MCEPPGYLRFLGLVANSRLVLTDSGGIQEETTVLGILCLTLRASTERPITCRVGTNGLVGNNLRRIREAARCVLKNRIRKSAAPDKWGGRTHCGDLVE